VYGNGAEGVLVKLSSEVSVSGVDIHDNGGSGVRIYGSTGVTVTGNTLTNNGLNAPVPEVVIQSYDDTTGVSGKFFPGSDNQIIDNTITGGANSTYGVAERNEDGTDRNTILDNTISNTTKGATLTYGDGTTVGETPPTTTPVGTAGDDTLTGTVGNDLLKGLAGNDTINAGNGNDILDGGAGVDTLTGGAGADTFVIASRLDSYRNYTTAAATKVDTITDFEAGQDRIDLSALGITGLGDGRNGTVYISLNAAGDKTYVKSLEADANGNRLELALSGNLLNTLKATDFIFAGTAPVNHAPTVAIALADQSAKESTPFSYLIPAGAFADVDNDTLTFTATLADGSALPAWLKFDAATRTFSGTPDINAAGTFNVKVTANDGKAGSVSDIFALAVQDTPVNHAPTVAAPLADQSAKETTPFSYAIPAGAFTDVDNDTLTFTATLADGSALPAWLKFDPATRTFSGTPDTNAAGTFNVKVTANDGKAGSVSDIFALAVQDTPVAAPIKTITGTSGKDTLTGTTANEQLVGLGGADVLNGAGGDDILVGGAGADKLTGGAGADIFRLSARTDSYRTSSTSYADTITDFVVGVDKIDLSGLGYTGLGNGYNGTLYLQYSSSSNTTYIKNYEADASGKRLELALTGNLLKTLKASDFIFNSTPSDNHAPVLATPLVDQSAKEASPFSYMIPATAFSDADNDALAFTATLADGSALPAWLKFDAATRTFSGTPDSNAAGALNIMVTANDGKTGTVSDTFTLAVQDTPGTPDTGIKIITGTSGKDTLTGTTANEQLVGLGGADVLNGAGGDDILIGGAGTDKLTGGAGADIFRLSARTDSYRTSSTSYADTITDFVVGVDKIDLSGLGYTGLGNGYNGTLYLQYSSSSNTTYIKNYEADASGKRLELALTGNLLKTLKATDFIFNSTPAVNHAPVLAAPLADQSATEAKAFTYVVPADAFSDADNDTLSFTATLADGSALPAWLSFDAASRTFSGTPDNSAAGSFSVIVTANDGKNGVASDTFTLEVKDVPPSNGDVLTGTAGQDRLVGTSASEQLFGLGGADILDGADGDDLLVGGAGADSLTGGAGADVYRFNAVSDSYRTLFSAYSDTITDFDPGKDVIDLTGLGFRGLGLGFNGTLLAQYDMLSGTTTLTSFDFDANGNAFELKLQGFYLTTLNATNLVFSSGTPPLNNAPVVTDSLQDVTATEKSAFSYTLSPTAFTDADNDTLTYTVTLQDGTALPSWLTFDPKTLTFSGTPGDTAAGVYSVLVTATDALGASASDVFALTVADAPTHTIVGTSAGDSLSGTAEDDLILGLGGADTINGNGGSDIIDGGAGRDTLSGGAGADSFRYTSRLDSYRDYDAGGVNAADTLKDFTVGVDKIDVKALGIVGLGDGTHDTLYITTSADGSKTYVKSAQTDADGNRFEITLDGKLSGTLSASDFVFAERAQQDILFVPTLGQSNARLLRMTEDDDQSGITEMVNDLTRYTGLDVRSQFNDADGNGIDVAVGGSTVSGLSTGTEEELRLSWWLTDTNQPGPALLRAVSLLQDQLASLKAIDKVTMAIVWGQGEEAAQEIGRASDPAAAAAAYKANTLKVFDYLHQQLGDFKVFMMKTGDYDADAARVRGYDEDKIASIQKGLIAVRQAQDAIILERADVVLGADYTDLPLREEADPVTYPDDVWHLHEESAEIVGQRLADAIANNLGYLGNYLDNRSAQDVYDEVNGQQGGYIQGTDQDDTLVGSAGNDTIDGDRGADTMSGGDGKDVYIVDDALDTVTETNASATQIDTVKASVSWTLGDNVEYLVLTGYSAINGTGNGLRNFITGNDAANVLDGQGGADSMTGGNGSDTYYVDNVDDTTVEKSSDSTVGGIDTVYTSLATWTLASNVENLVINTDGAANGIGNALDNRLVAGNGNNVLDGRDGIDTVSYALAQAGVTLALNTTVQQNTGGSGLDTLKYIENAIGSAYDDKITGSSAANLLDGGAGKDELLGGGGDDTLIGGAGNDSLTGGTGADTYVFTALTDLGLGALRDVIYGFKTTEADKLDLTALDANIGTDAKDSFTFIGSQAFDAKNAAGQLRFENGILYGSVNADASAEFEIQLVGVTQLHQSDFAA
uniref:putative Ig domain-containing protein n=1 Tax=Pseudomonas sp. DC3200b2 TaxID=2804669 RepID=UPI003CFB4940